MCIKQSTSCTEPGKYHMRRPDQILVYKVLSEWKK